MLRSKWSKAALQGKINIFKILLFDINLSYLLDTQVELLGL
jgi:hypothetical protein